MKTRILTILILVAVSLSGAQALADEPQGFVARLKQKWTEVSTEVKAKVKAKVDEWIDYWQGGDKTKTAQQQQQPQAPGQWTPPPVKITETNEQAQLRAQPIYEEKAPNSTLDDVKRVQQTVKDTPVLSVATPAVPGTSNLPKTKAGVPKADFKQFKVTKKIPRLDIGTEPTISAKDFNYGHLNWNPHTGAEFQRLPPVPEIKSQELTAALTMKVAPAKDPKEPPIQKQVMKAVNQGTIDAITYNLEVGEEANPLPYQALTPDELKMVAALILYEKGNNCPVVMGHFHELAQKAKTKLEATFHLGACARELKMHQAAFDYLSEVIRANDSEYSAAALEMLARDLQPIYERDFYNLAKSVPNFKSLIGEKSRDLITYRMAKGAYRAKDYKTSILYADQVSEKSDLHDDARVLSAMNSFAMGEKSKALKKLETTWASLQARKGPTSNIRALVAVNLARMYFSQKKYPKALESYMQVPKDHALWVQALIEQGWTQIAIEDYPGAIGNMYSLHSPYFKAVYQPESFVVRTIGYLNICQYGDAYKTLTWLEKDYRKWYDHLDAYLKTKSQGPLVYESVKSYIRGKSTESVDGVPFQLWREMARGKEFLNLQSAMNDKLDEVRRFSEAHERMNKAKASLLNRVAQANRRMAELRAKIAQVKVDKTLAKEVPGWRNSLKLEQDLVTGLRYQAAMIDENRKTFSRFERQSRSKIDGMVSRLSKQAGSVLLARAKEMRQEMARVLENNELLRYEVFAGSGENIRYQVAGGEAAGSNRVPAHIKPTKMMNWSFDGEFWEDEIGSYRSSLQNNCPKTAKR